LSVRFCDELECGFGWIVEEPLGRTSHAVLAGGGVWIVDPVEDSSVWDRIQELGPPAGVIQLLDRHERDCAEFARRLGVPLSVTPFAGVEQAPFRFISIRRNRFWREVALWWEEERVLVCADALGTIGYFRAGAELLGVHPLLRLRPPRQLAGLEPRVILVGHGEGVFDLTDDSAASALDEALRTARRRIPRLVTRLPTSMRR
jgi:hypothetical protein